MKLLLTGSTGYIGSALLKCLRARGDEVVAIGRLVDGEILSERLAAHKNQLDGCIHLASLFLTAHQEGQIPALIQSNVMFGTQLLEACVKLGCRWFINTGTFWQHYNMDNRRDYSPVNLYAATKQAFEDILKYYREAYGIQTATLELTDTYGSDDPRPKLINLWCRYLNSVESLPMSSGTQEIELVHRDDVVSGFATLARLMNTNDSRVIGNGEIYILPTSCVMTLREMATVFERATGGRLPIIWGGRADQKRGMRKVSHVGIVLPEWEPQVSLFDGFSDVYSCYIRSLQHSNNTHN